MTIETGTVWNLLESTSGSLGSLLLSGSLFYVGTINLVFRFIVPLVVTKG